MTEGITNQPRIPSSVTLSSVGNTATGATNSGVSNDVNSANSAATVAKLADSVSLSNVTQQVVAQPGFDQSKVNAIKLAIQNGNYALDPSRIAASFTALEKMIKE
jgi:negative regulator of flagellin synthesis FlgM